jgi:hypothetical protein
LVWGLGIGEGGFIRAQTAASSVAIDADATGGVVTSAKGPEAGVWAETTDLPTKFRKIVVTDDASCYVIPDLPEAMYKIWVRGYGLVDSESVQATRGQKLALKSAGSARRESRSAILSVRLLALADEDPSQKRVSDEVYDAGGRSTCIPALENRRGQA